jgi:hypothetical protein
VFGRGLHLSHAHHADRPHPLRRQVLISILIAALLALIALLLLPPRAHGNFVYWTDSNANTIARTKLNGTGTNLNLITGLDNPHGIAIDSKFIYWSQGNNTTGSIGRANLDGTGANPNFIPHSAGVNTPMGIAVTTSGVYWAQGGSIGHANLDGGSPNSAFIPVPGLVPCGAAADQNFVYWLDSGGLAKQIGRAKLDGSSPEPNFITVSANCGIAADSSFLYWGTDMKSVGRAPVAGGTPDNNFIQSAATSTGAVCGVGVNPQYAFWVNNSLNLSVTSFVGRANLSGTSPNPNFVQTGPNPCLLAVAPSNKITINSVTRKKKKGTAIVNAKVPGPGQVGIANTGIQDVAATATVKQAGLTLTAAGSFKLPIKPIGKTRKKLKKQVRKKGKGKVKVTAFVSFLPAGVAGVFNSEPVKVKLIKRGNKRH